MRKAILIVLACAAVFALMLRRDLRDRPEPVGYEIVTERAVPESGTKEKLSDCIRAEATVYITPSGQRWHLKTSCAGKNATESTKQDAEAIGYTPCQKCAGG